ncbi:MAG TPA: DEAD/DEAH box helicase [Anaeromyxobacteraceae bacterium]|nr:DEAD/DEAH box helicase [Anaeromyxobacteraceae bacterium]
MLTAFHPLVARWFKSTLGEPTRAQARGWAAIREGRHTLVAAPTGSGKTLAAFLSAIDALVREGMERPLPDETRVVYVSPLKALSADIHQNLAEPRRAIAALAESSGLEVPRITAAVRTGDTTTAQRAAMLKKPPHILVTTPESLYLLLTSPRSREMLRTARTVIVDEIHAVIGSRRGAHLALSLERLEEVADGRLLRIGLSATQTPIEVVARYLVGQEASRGACAIVDEGHRREMDLAIEVPGSPLEAVMAHEVWCEYHARLAELVARHDTTLVFVNTRRLAERLARDLGEIIGSDQVKAHHGSLSKELRLEAERRLRSGDLKALVATASLELGIDIGHVDLVCQIGSPHRIAALLQRVGRSGHTLRGLPKGRLFPLSRDDLLECTALLRAVRRGELDRIVSHDAPVDVLAQQVTAELACREYPEDALYALVRRAWPYRDLARADFDRVVAMLSEGFATRRGRRAALLHRDEVHGTARARRGTRMLAITSGGAIPEVADYRVIVEPEETFVGTLNEDFAIESTAGDVFQLGTTSWQITRVSPGVVRVVDAHGAPPTIPFWLGEAPARSDELSRAVSDLRGDVGERLDGAGATEWLATEAGVSPGAAEQVVEYVRGGRAALGVVPTQRTLVLERFFDESGGSQLVLHAPFGSRINRAWGLALRKRFCRQFNFELQAAATEDAVLLSLGPQHSFPLADVFRYLHPATARDVLVQAFLAAPVFATRWRWNATISLAVPRCRGGVKVPPQLQRMQADDLMAAVFPDAAACLENIPGDREIPAHPLVDQTVRDCLEDAMDFPGLAEVLARIHRGELRLESRDTPEPSAFAHEILNARPYAFLDDAPLEERRAQAVQSRRPVEVDDGLGRLDAGAIERVRDEERPDPRDADELHDALLVAGHLLEDEVDPPLFDVLVRASRATRVVPADGGGGAALLVAAERLPEVMALHPDASLVPPLAAPPGRAARAWERADALVEVLRGRLAIVGPTTSAALARWLALSEGDVYAALLRLEAEGVVLRGAFTPGAATAGAGSTPPAAPAVPPAPAALEWCDRRLLARIHRYTLHRLRAEIAPVSAADFMRFLFAWQHADPAHVLTGTEGLRALLTQLDGLELPARAWEKHVLPARLDRYDPAQLDVLCLTGEACWARLSRGPTQVIGATPIALFRREHGGAWSALRQDTSARAERADPPLGDVAARVLAHLRSRGASFANELTVACGLRGDELRGALGDLVAAGLVTSDGFAGLRAIIGGPAALDARSAAAGRWSVIADAARPGEESEPEQPGAAGRVAREGAVEAFAWALLRRDGVVFRRLLERETAAVPWRELVRVYRRLEARGEIRGGRFVSGMSGEQFALPDAVERLREVRRGGPDGRLIIISAADPLNLTGIVTPGERVRSLANTRLVYRNGVPLAALEGDFLRLLGEVEESIAREVAAAAAGRPVPVMSGFVGRV